MGVLAEGMTTGAQCGWGPPRSQTALEPTKHGALCVGNQQERQRESCQLACRPLTPLHGRAGTGQPPRPGSGAGKPAVTPTPGPKKVSTPARTKHIGCSMLSLSSGWAAHRRALAREPAVRLELGAASPAEPRGCLLVLGAHRSRAVPANEHIVSGIARASGSSSSKQASTASTVSTASQ